MKEKQSLPTFILGDEDVGGFSLRVGMFAGICLNVDNGEVPATKVVSWIRSNITTIIARVLILDESVN